MSLNLQKSAGTTSATGKENVRELLHVIKSGGDKKGNIFVSWYLFFLYYGKIPALIIHMSMSTANVSWYLTFWEVYSNILGSVHGYIG